MNQERPRDVGPGRSDPDPPRRGPGPGEGPPPPRRPPLALASPKRAPPRLADHTYRDYSRFPASELPWGKKSIVNFPSKLHRILSDPEYAHIISWMPHGRAWKIHSRELLVRDVISKHFAQRKYESFTRQLNGWGFKRLHQSGCDYNACYHECFLRGLPHLTALMRRVPPNRGKQVPHVEGEPNFYAMEREYPLPPPLAAPSGTGYGAPPDFTGAPPGPPYSPSNRVSPDATDYGAPPGALSTHASPSAAGYGAPPGPPYYASNYSHPPPYYYHHGGDPHSTPPPYYYPHGGDPAQTIYSPYSYHPAPNGHPPPYPYPGPPGPHYPTQTEYNTPPPSGAVAPAYVRNEGDPGPPGPHYPTPTEYHSPPPGGALVPAYARNEEECHVTPQGSVQEVSHEGDTEENDPLEPIGLFPPRQDQW